MTPVTPGATFGNYQIIEAIGRGGMASVYKGYEAALDRYVALKVLPAEFLHEETFAARFQREAKVIAKLEHPNIIPIFAFGIEQGIPWMSMRLIRGGSVSAGLKQGRPSRERAVAIVRAVADALTYAHAQGVVHRDVKPHNILVDEQGRVYLADFGIARMVEGGAAITRTGLVSGTPQYMAPEQATGQPLDHRVDVYALGVVAYELLTGSTPFTADTPVAVLMKQVSAPIPIPSKDLVPESLLGPLLKSLAKNPEERFQTAAAFADALEKGMGSIPTAVVTAVAAPSPARVAPPPPPPAPRSSVRPAAVPPVRTGSGLLTGVVLAGLGLLVVGGSAVGMWLWLRSRAVVPEGGGPTSVATVTEPVVTAPAAVLPSSNPTPHPSDAPTTPLESPASRRPVVPTPLASPARPVLGAGPAVAPVTTAPPPPQTMPAPVLTAPAATPVAVSAPGFTFRINERTNVGTPSVGPVTLLSAHFKKTRPDELETQLEFQCAKGKDQAVTYEVTFLDGSGAVVFTVKGKKGVEENESATFKQKQRLDASLLVAVKWFRVSFEPEPD